MSGHPKGWRTNWTLEICVKSQTVLFGRNDEVGEQLHKKFGARIALVRINHEVTLLGEGPRYSSRGLFVDGLFFSYAYPTYITGYEFEGGQRIEMWFETRSFAFPLDARVGDRVSAWPLMRVEKLPKKSIYDEVVRL